MGSVHKPGFFEPGTVGGDWGDYLKSLYSEDPMQSRSYIGQSTALRDALSKEAGAQGEQLATASNAGGFYDSGARLSGLGDINRNKMASYSKGLTDIVGKLESDKLNAAYPFLQAQLGEYNSYYNARLGEQNARNYRANAAVSNIMSAFSLGMRGGSSAQTAGNYQVNWPAVNQSSYGSTYGAGTDY